MIYMLLDTHKNAGDVIAMRYMAILHRSEALTPEGGSAEQDILATSRRNNAAAGLTGFLHRENDIYYQWLEGPEAQVAALFGQIAVDGRHRLVKLLSRRAIPVRKFQGWTMGYANTNQGSLFDWAFEHEVPLHLPRPEDILAFMQPCARQSRVPPLTDNYLAP